jgi:hypothetical protein
VFTPGYLLDLGSRATVGMALKSTCDRGLIRRLARGLYDYPQQHPKLGLLTPTPEQIALALAGKDNLRIQPSGAYAANLLGLSEQVPAKVVFLTNGPERRRKVGNQEIVLKRTTPKNMPTAGRASGLVIQALRYLGQNHIAEPYRRHSSRPTSPAARAASTMRAGKHHGNRRSGNYFLILEADSQPGNSP